MAAAIGGVFAVLVACAGLALTLLTIREKLWPTPQPRHPLVTELQDIASAIRDLRGV